MTSNREHIIDRDRLIDRLVDGALNDDERRVLLTALGLEPDGQGWRRLALGFLESQCWAESLSRNGELADPVQVVERVKAPRRGARWLAAAALVALAFTAGWLGRGAPPADAVVGAKETSVPEPVTREASHPGSAQPAVRRASQTSESQRVDPDPDASEIRELQRKGFRVERSQRFVSLGLPDGRDVKVPVDELRLRYVGDRMY